MTSVEDTIAGLYAEVLTTPRTFNEKLRWKMRHDRNPLLTITADKYSVQGYVKRLGLGHLLKAQYWVGSDANLIPFHELPAQFAVKSTHSSGDVILVDDCIDRTTGLPISSDGIATKASEWLARRHWNEANEWAYADIKPRILIEELLINDNRSPSADFKFFCFDGKPAIVKVIEDRYGDYTGTYYDTEWKHLPFVWTDWPGMLSKAKPGRPDIPKPSNLADMIAAAAVLSNPFDFVRVDLYSHNGRIYFGELTHYPSAGIGEFDPASYDVLLGSLWTLRGV